MARWPIHADGDRSDASGNAVGVTTQIQGVVSSVDLTQSPPLLTIAGQTYTVNQVQRIAN